MTTSFMDYRQTNAWDLSKTRSQMVSILNPPVQQVRKFLKLLATYCSMQFRITQIKTKCVNQIIPTKRINNILPMVPN